MINPRKNTKFLLRVFGNDRELYKEYLALFDEATEEGSAIPDEVAWIRFREYHIETEEGWSKI